MSVFPMKILLATDGSADAARATEAASDLASRSDSELHVVHVWHDVPGPYRHAFVKRELRRQGEEILQEQVQKIESAGGTVAQRSEEHTSELQSRQYLVCRLLLEKKKRQHPP